LSGRRIFGEPYSSPKLLREQWDRFPQRRLHAREIAGENSNHYLKVTHAEVENSGICAMELIRVRQSLQAKRRPKPIQRCGQALKGLQRALRARIQVESHHSVLISIIVRRFTRCEIEGEVSARGGPAYANEDDRCGAGIL